MGGGFGGGEVDEAGLDRGDPAGQVGRVDRFELGVQLVDLLIGEDAGIED